MFLPLRAFSLALLVWLAGCAGAAPTNAPDASFGAEETVLEGRVIDEEFQPVADAEILVTPGDHAMRTTETGGFRFGPVEPGVFSVFATKLGYADASTDVDVVDGIGAQVTLVLKAVATNVPYHTTTHKSALMDCAIAAQGLSTRCNPVDRVTGQNITGDESRVLFEVPDENLANLLFEVDWAPTSASARDVRVWWEPRGSAVALGGVTPQYMLIEGGPPLRLWIAPGEVGPNGNTEFDGKKGAQYTGQNRPSVTNSTLIVGSFYLQQRVDNWFTWFHNRVGPPDFSVLPDT